jgi:hypothetical protein
MTCDTRANRSPRRREFRGFDTRRARGERLCKLGTRSELTGLTASGTATCSGCDLCAYPTARFLLSVTARAARRSTQVSGKSGCDPLRQRDGHA